MHDLLTQLPSMLAQAADAVSMAASTTAPADVTPAAASPWIAWIQDYGAIFIFVAFIVCGVGLHISEDFLLIPAGVAIHDGHMSTSLCHLANISYRVGRSLKFNGAQEKFVNDREADALLTRVYRAGYVVPATV